MTKQESLINMYKDQENYTIDDIAKSLDVSVATLSRHITRLLKEGKIEKRRGRGRRSSI